MYNCTYCVHILDIILSVSKHILNSSLRSCVVVINAIVTALQILRIYFQELSGKEKEMLENEMKEKVAKRDTALEKAKQVKSQLKL